MTRNWVAILPPLWHFSFNSLILFVLLESSFVLIVVLCAHKINAELFSLHSNLNSHNSQLATQLNSQLSCGDEKARKKEKGKSFISFIDFVDYLFLL